ncbi:hypothetical protein HMPREF0602_1556 [Neisseria meningitidis ATCC 13091]|uniref:Uncharacterized protein n=1 Tax=Neisseria meningitidis serogroup B (strain ATCC 13091 / M2091) TaxID=862513 RepID=E0NAM4_NEIM3|nr:hypothetical protein HMPREF0602_1556 [Neisseria meningitidis ATCC 13091]
MSDLLLFSLRKPFLQWIKFKPVRRCLALPYYLYCLRLRRLVLIFVNPL